MFLPYQSFYQKCVSPHKESTTLCVRHREWLKSDFLTEMQFYKHQQKGQEQVEFDRRRETFLFLHHTAAKPGSIVSVYQSSA